MKDMEMFLQIDGGGEDLEPSLDMSSPKPLVK